MRHALKIHPGSICPAVERIDVEVSRDRDLLTLRYFVTGRIADIRLPPESAPVRAEELWEQTCFEAFVGTETAYLELNFAPSTAWAAYRFNGYRDGKCDAGIEPPQITTTRGPGHFELDATAQILRWEGHLGLAAVIEEMGGRKSYWAFAHAPPDFHHRDSFALDLPAAG